MIIAKSMAMKIDNDPTHVMTFYLLYIYFFVGIEFDKEEKGCKILL